MKNFENDGSFVSGTTKLQTPDLAPTVDGKHSEGCKCTYCDPPLCCQKTFAGHELVAYYF